MEQIIKALESLRIGLVIEETDLQAQIALVLLQHGISFEREYMLGQGNRIDFYAAGGIGIEVKKGKPNRTRLLAQINRYAAFDDITAVIIVVETSLRDPIDRAQNGTPCAVIGLQKLWGIAL